MRTGAFVEGLAAASPALCLLAGGPALALLRDRVPFAVGDGALWVLGAVTAMGGLVLALIGLRRPVWAIICGASGVFLFAAMLAYPAGWTIFEPDNLLTPGWAVGLATVVLAALTWVAARRVAAAVVIGGALVSLSCAGLLAVAAQRRVDPPLPPQPATTASAPNIYQFVFDGMSADVFDAASAANAFPGFTVYPRNRANYVATDASLPSMFTGRFFKGGSFRAFQDEARAGGYRTALAKAGYRTWLYTPDRNRFWWLDAASNPRTAQDMRWRENDPSGVKTLLQTGLVAASPPGLKRPMLELTRLIWPWSKYNSYKQELGLLDAFLADEKRRSGRGNYVYFHIIIPHPPYRWDEQCGRSRSSYTAQAGCAVTMMKRVVRVLGAQGKLRDSLIIFQGDHGFHAGESNLPARRAPIPAALRQKLLATNDSFGPDDLIQRTRAFLLVHAAGASFAPLKASAGKTQLIDIAPTIAQTAGLDWPRGVGRSLVGGNNAPRDWHFFAGVTSKTGLFRTRLGRDTDQGRIAHFSMTPQGRWLIHDDIAVRGNGRHRAR